MKICAFLAGALLMAAFLLSMVGCTNSRSQVHSATKIAEVELKRVHFTTGSDELDEEAISILGFNKYWLKLHPQAVLILEGHCDERGGANYNLQLGDRRARMVKAYLIAMGVDPERLIMVVSHGELRPLDPSHNPDAWRKNRRVEFIIR